MLENGLEIVGFCDAAGGFIVFDMNFGWIWIYLPPREISRVACSRVGLDGYGFGGVVVEVVVVMIWDDGHSIERGGMMGYLLEMIRILFFQ